MISWCLPGFFNRLPGATHATAIFTTGSDANKFWGFTPDQVDTWNTYFRHRQNVRLLYLHRLTCWIALKIDPFKGHNCIEYLPTISIEIHSTWVAYRYISGLSFSANSGSILGTIQHYRNVIKTVGTDIIDIQTAILYYTCTGIFW